MATEIPPIRKERSDNRELIRTQSDEALFNVLGNLSTYAELRKKSFDEILRTAGAQTAADLRNPFPSLTGALQPVLPMYISISDRDNARLRFMLLVNPVNMTHGKTSSVQASYTRKGWVTQMWGPNQDLLTSTGKTAAFMDSGTGLTNLGRTRSASYVNFLAFLFSYRNNGYQMLDPTALGERLTRVINLVHGVEIDYDGQIFTGHFNNFTIDEGADRPYLFDYNFEFVCTTLSDDFNEVRGHFLPLGETIAENEARLLGDITKQKTVAPGTGRLSPPPFEGDLTVPPPSPEEEQIDAEIRRLEQELAELG